VVPCSFILRRHSIDHVVEPAGHQGVTDVEGVAARGTTRREVVYRNAGRTHFLDDVVSVQAPSLAAGEARAGGGHGLDLPPGDARILQRRLDRLPAHLCQGPVSELSPGMHPQAHGRNLSHAAHSPFSADAMLLRSA
jgi:hypothetical protein